MHSRLVKAACLASLAACSSSTVIRSYPSGAHVFLDGSYVGDTPYKLSDRKIVSSTTSIRLEYPGLAPYDTTIARNESFSVLALVGGIFVLVPFLWIMDYKGEHAYDLTAARPQPGAPAPQPQPGSPQRGEQPGAPPRGEQPGAPPRGNPPGAPPRGNPPGAPPRGNPPGAPPRGNPPGEPWLP